MESGKVLSGWKLSALRAARWLQVLDAYLWYRQYIQGDIFTLIPFDDPLDTSHLLVALSKQVADHPHHHIEIGVEDFRDWLDAATRSHPNFNATKCFRQFIKDLPTESNKPILMNFDGACSFVFAQRNKMVIEVVHRRGHVSQFTRGQMHRMMQRLMSQAEINQDVIAKCRAEALSRDWTSPFPGLRDDQPFEIIINQVSLTQRIKRFLARIP